MLIRSGHARSRAPFGGVSMRARRLVVLAAALAPLAWSGVARAQQQPGATGTSSSSPPPGTPTGTVPNPNPASDAQDLVKQGQHRPSDGGVPTRPTDVFSDDWFGRAR